MFRGVKIFLDKTELIKLFQGAIKVLWNDRMAVSDFNDTDGCIFLSWKAVPEFLCVKTVSVCAEDCACPPL